MATKKTLVLPPPSLAPAKPRSLRAVDVKKTTEAWSVYDLEDGTKLRVKPVVAEVQRVVGEYSSDGEPIYVVKTSLVLSTRVPKNLMKK